MGLLTAPMRSRFSFNCRLDYYDSKTLSDIIIRSSKILGLNLSDQGAQEIAARARGTPRIANNLIRWVRDYAQIKNNTQADQKTVTEALRMLSIDHKGLDEMDKKILDVIIDYYKGGPVGISTIAVAIGEDPDTISDVYEPYLIMQGFLKRTPRGREVTQQAYEHLGRSIPAKFNSGDTQ
jgi:Holliday junction DNA helicase RuvB